MNTTICGRLFQIGFSPSVANECSVSLLRDVRLHSLTITRDAQIMGLWGPSTGFLATVTRGSQYETVASLGDEKL